MEGDFNDGNDDSNGKQGNPVRLIAKSNYFTCVSKVIADDAGM
jgi:hypothetical protein